MGTQHLIGAEDTSHLASQRDGDQAALEQGHEALKHIAGRTSRIRSDEICISRTDAAFSGWVNCCWQPR